MEWTLIVAVLVGGALSDTASFSTIPMKSRMACVTALEDFAKRSKVVQYFCVSSETGEIVRKRGSN